MRVIALKTLRAFWERRPDARQPLQAWYQDALHATWTSPAEITDIYRNASILPHNRVVFNIKGNHYRLVAMIQYKFGIVYIRFIGTHAEYDHIDATII
jgi:mRNA interferase HigB